MPILQKKGWLEIASVENAVIFFPHIFLSAIGLAQARMRKIDSLRAQCTHNSQLTASG